MASGETLATIQPLEYAPGTTAQPVKLTNDTVLAFDGTTAEFAYYKVYCPRSYEASGFDVQLALRWPTISGTKSRWEVAVARIPEDTEDPDSPSFDTVSALSLDEPGTANYATYDTLSVSNTDSIVVGEWFYLRVKRDPTHADDDTAADVQLMGIEVTES